MENYENGKIVFVSKDKEFVAHQSSFVNVRSVSPQPTNLSDRKISDSAIPSGLIHSVVQLRHKNESPSEALQRREKRKSVLSSPLIDGGEKDAEKFNEIVDNSDYRASGLKKLKSGSFESIARWEKENEFLFAIIEDECDWLTRLFPDETLEPDNFFESLEDGVILCKLARLCQNYSEEFAKKNNARVTCFPIFIHPRKRCRGRLGQFMSRENVELFLKWCRAQKIHESLLFESNDVVEKTESEGLRENAREIVLCLMEVARLGVKWGVEPPKLILLEREIELEEQMDTSSLDGSISPVSADSGLDESFTYQSPVSSKGSNLTPQEKDVDKMPEHDSIIKQIQKEIEIDDNNMSEQGSLMLKSKENKKDHNDSSAKNSCEGERVMNSCEGEREMKEHKNEQRRSSIRRSSIDADSSSLKKRRKSSTHIKSELHQKVTRIIETYNIDSMLRLKEGKYVILGKVMFVRLLNDHCIVRIGGGWDSLEHYLMTHLNKIAPDTFESSDKLGYESSHASSLTKRRRKRSSNLLRSQKNIFLTKSTPNLLNIGNSPNSSSGEESPARARSPSPSQTKDPYFKKELHRKRDERKISQAILRVQADVESGASMKRAASLDWTHLKNKELNLRNLKAAQTIPKSKLTLIKKMADIVVDPKPSELLNSSMDDTDLPQITKEPPTPVAENDNPLNYKTDEIVIDSNSSQNDGIESVTINKNGDKETISMTTKTTKKAQKTRTTVTKVTTKTSTSKVLTKTTQPVSGPKTTVKKTITKTNSASKPLTKSSAPKNNLSTAPKTNATATKKPLSSPSRPTSTIKSTLTKTKTSVKPALEKSSTDAASKKSTKPTSSAATKSSLVNSKVNGIGKEKRLPATSPAKQTVSPAKQPSKPMKPTTTQTTKAKPSDRATKPSVTPTKTSTIRPSPSSKSAKSTPTSVGTPSSSKATPKTTGIKTKPSKSPSTTGASKPTVAKSKTPPSSSKPTKVVATTKSRVTGTSAKATTKSTVTSPLTKSATKSKTTSSSVKLSSGVKQASESKNKTVKKENEKNIVLIPTDVSSLGDDASGMEAFVSLTHRITDVVSVQMGESTQLEEVPTDNAAANKLSAEVSNPTENGTQIISEYSNDNDESASNEPVESIGLEPPPNDVLMSAVEAVNNTESTPPKFETVDIIKTEMRSEKCSSKDIEIPNITEAEVSFNESSPQEVETVTITESEIRLDESSPQEVETVNSTESEIRLDECSPNITEAQVSFNESSPQEVETVTITESEIRLDESSPQEVETVNSTESEIRLDECSPNITEAQVSFNESSPQEVETVTITESEIRLDESSPQEVETVDITESEIRLDECSPNITETQVSFNESSPQEVETVTITESEIRLDESSPQEVETVEITESEIRLDECSPNITETQVSFDESSPQEVETVTITESEIRLDESSPQEVETVNSTESEIRLDECSPNITETQVSFDESSPQEVETVTITESEIRLDESSPQEVETVDITESEIRPDECSSNITETKVSFDESSPQEVETVTITESEIRLDESSPQEVETVDITESEIRPDECSSNITETKVSFDESSPQEVETVTITESEIRLDESSPQEVETVNSTKSDGGQAAEAEEVAGKKSEEIGWTHELSDPVSTFQASGGLPESDFNLYCVTPLDNNDFQSDNDTPSPVDSPRACVPAGLELSESRCVSDESTPMSDAATCGTDRPSSQYLSADETRPTTEEEEEEQNEDQDHGGRTGRLGFADTKTLMLDDGSCTVTDAAAPENETPFEAWQEAEHITTDQDYCGVEENQRIITAEETNEGESLFERRCWADNENETAPPHGHESMIVHFESTTNAPIRMSIHDFEGEPDANVFSPVGKSIMEDEYVFSTSQVNEEQNNVANTSESNGKILMGEFRSDQQDYDEESEASEEQDSPNHHVMMKQSYHSMQMTGFTSEEIHSSSFEQTTTSNEVHPQYDSIVLQSAQHGGDAY